MESTKEKEMDYKKKNLEEDIYKLRNKLNDLLKTNSCLSLEVLRISEQLDSLIVKYHDK